MIIAVSIKKPVRIDIGEAWIEFEGVKTKVEAGEILIPDGEEITHFEVVDD